MESVSLVIDGQKVEAQVGKTVLEAALENKIYVPNLCYHSDLKPVGVCRLCIVDIKGRGELAPACVTPVEEGMVVKTETPEIRNIRRTTVELLVLNHHRDCLSCSKNTKCRLQEVANYIGIEERRLKRYRPPQKSLAIDSSNPFFDRHMDRCILCGICVRACSDISGTGAIDYAFRGYNATVATFQDKPLVESNCESCGECLVRCPTGALAPKGSQVPTREVKSVCPYCGCGCSIYLGVRGEEVVSVRADAEGPTNRGRLCVKGRFGFKFINHPDRLTSPLIRKDGEFVKASWDEALTVVATRFARYRGDQFAAVASAKCTNEDNYVFQKFVRAVMFTNNVDHCARLCHAPSVAGLATMLGSGAMTNSVGEIASSRCLFVIGTNPTEAYPVIGYEIRKAARGGAKLIVANPKAIDLFRQADIVMQHKPGTDVALLMGMMHVIVAEGLHNRAFIEERCENFDAFAASLAKFDLSFVSAITGVPRETIVASARLFATTKPAGIYYSMGVTQHSHGTDNVMAIANLALLTGNVGKPSSGVNPFRGQNNVQGACDMGALPVFFPGYQRVDNADLRKKFETAWGCTLSPEPGLTLTQFFQAAHAGHIRAMYLMGENPVLTVADSNEVLKGIEKLEFFVVQDIFMTETASRAHVVLPAASFAEKEGTFTNTERRVQRVRKAIEPVGESKPDWQIICEIARKMVAGDGASGRPTGFDYKSASEIFDEIASLTPPYGGISYARLESGGVQWPCPTADHPGTPILHTEKFATPSGKAKFMPLEYRPPAEVPDEEYQFVLTTNRSLFHYHGGTMTRRVAGLNALVDQEWLEMNPDDARRLGIADGEMVRILSRRGEVTARCLITDTSPRGVVSLTFHFAESPTNVLTNAALDPVAKTPETKVCAVRIEKAF